MILREVTPALERCEGVDGDSQGGEDNQDVEKQMFPPCNVGGPRQMVAGTGAQPKSGGVARDWWVPGLYYPARQPRCACVGIGSTFSLTWG